MYVVQPESGSIMPLNLQEGIDPPIPGYDDYGRYTNVVFT